MSNRTKSSEYLENTDKGLWLIVDILNYNIPSTPMHRNAVCLNRGLGNQGFKAFPDTCEVGKYFLFLLCLEKTGINNLEVMIKQVVNDFYIGSSQYEISFS